VPNGVDEAKMKLYFYSESLAKWEEIPETDIIKRDTTANTVEFKLRHLTQFSLSGPYQVYLPAVMKQQL
jgi:adenine-specific DNA glycosylase